MISFDAYRGAAAGGARIAVVAVPSAVSHIAVGWHRPIAAAAATAMPAARLATAGHVADIPQRKRTAENFVFVNRGNT